MLSATYKDFDPVFMFWSPIVKRAKRATTTYDAVKEFEAIKNNLSTHGVKLDVYINHEFKEAFMELRKKASKETKAMVSPVMRLFQIENRLDTHLENY